VRAQGQAQVGGTARVCTVQVGKAGLPGGVLRPEELRSNTGG
jgi:hypothetical protein